MYRDVFGTFAKNIATVGRCTCFQWALVANIPYCHSIVITKSEV